MTDEQEPSGSQPAPHKAHQAPAEPTATSPAAETARAESASAENRPAGEESPAISPAAESAPAGTPRPGDESAAHPAEAPPAQPPAGKRPPHRTRTWIAATAAGVMLLGGGLAGYFIGAANDHDRRGGPGWHQEWNGSRGGDFRGDFGDGPRGPWNWRGDR